VTQLEKLHAKIVAAQNDANVSFSELRSLLLNLGFDERIRGSHHIFRRDGVREKVNIQADGKMAKPYQVKQVREILLRYRLGGKK